MLKSPSSNKRTVFDVVNIVTGLGLLVSPWLLSFATETHAVWNASLIGAAIAVIAAAALYASYEREEWVNLVLGIWTVAAPWVLGFVGEAAMWVHVVAGLIVAVLAAASIWFSHNRPLPSV
ncbi:SPW repeat protein [Rhizobium leguminosarum]|uniref:SPW repeat protein n=1 Tax=Rhizobium leguminosarum TaxID=384 RepID=UPI003D069A6C